MADGDDRILDDEAWARGELYWRELVDEILASIGQAGEWPSWEPRFYGDRLTPIEREYRSICDGRSWRLDRSFAIEQFAYTGEPAGISARVKDYAEEIQDFPDIENAEDANAWFEQVPARDRVPRSTLIISLEFSDATAASARSLLTVWLKPETTVAAMRAFLDDGPDVNR